jgi:hypothetical protein
MGRPVYPPSLVVTPARIERCLKHEPAVCAHCGYSLRGLKTPKCPECAEWTDVTRLAFEHNMDQAEHQLGDWGVLDGFLVERGVGRLERAIPLDEVEELTCAYSIARWFDRRIKLTICMCSLCAALVLLASSIPFDDPPPYLELCLCLVAALGAVLVPKDGSEVARAVVRHADGVETITLRGCGREEIEATLELWREAKEAPPPDYDALREKVTRERAEAEERGLCPQCGYGLEGPAVMERVRRSTQSSIAFIVVAGVAGPFILLAFLRAAFEYYESFGAEFVFISLALLWVIGSIVIELRRRTRTILRPAVPDWPGPGSCGACGWRPEQE